MTGPPPSDRRRGYALPVVLIFLILLFALWSTVYRTTSSLLRIEANRASQQSRDQGAMNALAQAIQLLQYSAPSDPTNPARSQFTYGVQVSVPTAADAASCATSDYTVTYTARPDLGAHRWEIQISPGNCSVPLPNPGASPQWP
jgi:Tfp pilus assembly protein PilX